MLALYARGQTTGDIHGPLEELYGVEVSPMLVSTITVALQEDMCGRGRVDPFEDKCVRHGLYPFHCKVRNEGDGSNRS
ncbi:MAG: transposase [Nitrospira sp.]|nr:transposase [Nitrospira sp.]